MAFRITLECGDTSCLRTKKTQEGYTHDWEVFVRGVDNAAVHHYIEKVVFNLHETFPKPKRVIKEPPYTLKESGYAGFDIPIHIYFKNKNEPKRFEIMYNLNLETTVPAVSHIVHHSHVINNPTDEFRKKLLKGGATPVPVSSTDSASEKNEVKTLPMVGKPKLSGYEGKKHRISEPKTSNPFNDLFGIPIKTVKVFQDNKKISDKSSSARSISSIPEKVDKSDKSSKVKHSPHKDTKKEKSFEERKEKREKDKDIIKDKEKIKEKSKRSSSPSNKVSYQSSESKRSLSPSPMKKPITPPPIQKRPYSPSSKQKERDIKKIVDPDKEKEKIKENLKNISEDSKNEKENSKSERKKDKKKHREDRDKEKKEKYKDKERDKSRDSKDSGKSVEKKTEKSDKLEKEIKHSKEERKSPKTVRENEKIKDEKISKSDKSEKGEKLEKQRELKSEKSDKSKHKHKKRDKKDKRDVSKEREKKERREKSKSSSEKQNEVINQTLTTLVTPRSTDVQERESSDSAGSADEEISIESKAITAVKKGSAPPDLSAEIFRIMSPPPPPVSDIKKDKSDRKRDRSKSSKEDKESKKKKRKSESKAFGEEEASKKSKELEHSTSPLVEPVSSSQSPIAANIGSLHVSKVKHASNQTPNEPATGDSEQVAPDSTNSTFVDTEEPLIFSEDYVSQLKDLQQKIMTLQDNHELQRVVQVIAETGQYEITKKTFDFDLCALDRRTVQRLQQFFAS